MSEQSQAVARVAEPRKLNLDQLVAAPSVGGGVTFLPRTLTECLDFATIMSKSDFAIPPKFRQNVGACLAVTIQACRWEADPFGVIQKAYITTSKDGSERLAYEAQLFAAIVNTRAPLAGRLDLQYSGEGATRAVKVIGVFRDTGEVRDVQTPGVAKIKKQSPLWAEDPDQQLAYYGIRAWARRWVPELMLGIYSPDEFQEAPLVDAPRPTRKAHVVDTQRAEGVEVRREPEPVRSSEDVIATAEELIPKPDDVVVDAVEETPITHVQAERMDEMREDARAAEEPEPPEFAEVEEGDAELQSWEEFLGRAIERLHTSGDPLRTEADFDDFGDRTKAAIMGSPLRADDKDDIRARFISALLTRKRAVFGRRR